MKLKAFGGWSPEEFQDFMARLGPSWHNDSDMLVDQLRVVKSSWAYQSFIEVFREFILDDSICLEDKARFYLEEDNWTETDTWDHLKWLWENLVPGEPWPLEGTPRPPEDLRSRSYEFKPE